MSRHLPRRPRGRLLALLGTALGMLLASPSGPRAEHGMPWMLAGPQGGVLPPNGRVVLQSSNGVAWHVSALYRRSPDARAVLRSTRETVPLRVVDAFDDLEGGPRQAFASEAGYGESLVVLAPTRRLRPGDRYDLVLSHKPRPASPAARQASPAARPAPAAARSAPTAAPWPEHVLRSFAVSRAPDRRPPAWWLAPHLEYREDENQRGVHAEDQATLVASLRDEPGLVLLELAWQPLGKAPLRRQLIAFDPDRQGGARADRPAAHGETCREAALHGTERPAGARYRLTLTAIDLAGHRARAPGSPFVLSFPASGAVTVCVRRPATRAEVRP